MKTMDKTALLNGLAQWGYPLMQALPENEPEDVLLNLLRQKDMRLLEGFPVVFYRMLQEKPVSRWEEDSWDSGSELTAPLLFVVMVWASLLLFEKQNVDPLFLERSRKVLAAFPAFSHFQADFRKSFEGNKGWKVKTDAVEFELSPERFKKTFARYWEKDRVPAADQKKYQLEEELLLSEFFTPKQKQLMRKKLEGKELTKTEREYFSRVVKKRLRALADERLHHLAQKLVA